MTVAIHPSATETWAWRRRIIAAGAAALALSSYPARADIPVPRPPCMDRKAGDACDVEGDRGVCRVVAPREARFRVCAPLYDEPGPERCTACILPPDPTLYEPKARDDESPLQERAPRGLLLIAVGLALTLPIGAMLVARARRRS